MPLQVDENGFVFDPEKKLFLPPLNLKQFEIFQDRHRYLLVHGPRKSGKTFGIEHKVIRHAFEVNDAMVAIVCKTIKNAKAAGVWVLMLRMMQFWLAGCVGFKITEGPKQTGDSKMSYVRIRNTHGERPRSSVTRWSTARRWRPNSRGRLTRCSGSPSSTSAATNTPSIFSVMHCACLRR